jgi:hypothetical protein
MANIGVITEQGDLGLGFDEISVEEQAKIKENDSNKEGTKMAPEVTTK